MQIGLIGAMGILFFLAARAADHRLSLTALGVACVVVLAIILFIARHAKPAASGTARPPSRGRVAAFLIALTLLEVTQLSTLNMALRVGCALAGLSLILLALRKSNTKSGP